jgi:hypothetical protein
VWDPGDNSVLAELFSTEPGDPPFPGWTERMADLNPWIGQTIRLAFTQQDGLFFFNVRLDEVRIVGQPPLPVRLDINPGGAANFVDPLPGTSEPNRPSRIHESDQLFARFSEHPPKLGDARSNRALAFDLAHDDG